MVSQLCGHQKKESRKKNKFSGSNSLANAWAEFKRLNFQDWHWRRYLAPRPTAVEGLMASGASRSSSRGRLLLQCTNPFLNLGKHASGGLDSLASGKYLGNRTLLLDRFILLCKIFRLHMRLLRMVAIGMDLLSKTGE